MVEQFSIREIVHALRNPLTAILSNLELLTQGYISELDEETKNILSEILFNAKYMETLMRNASDTVKIKESSELACREINIKETLIGIINEMKTITDDIDSRIFLEIENHPYLISEPDMIKRFFTVILYELFKFTTQLRKLKVKILKDHSTLLITINFTERFDKEILDEEKIFNELFITPTQRQNKLNFLYFTKVLNLFNGKATIVKENNIIFLQITFTQKKLSCNKD